MAQPGQTITEPDSFLGTGDPLPPGDGSGAGTGTGTALVFQAGSLYCALPLDEIIETMRPLPVQPLAGTGATVRGVCVLRGTPTPVVDVAQVLGGHPAAVSRYVAVRTARGPVALATGQVFGVQPVDATAATGARTSLLTEAPDGLITGVGTFRGEPLLLLRGVGVLAAEIWAVTSVRAGRP